MAMLFNVSNLLVLLVGYRLIKFSILQFKKSNEESRNNPFKSWLFLPVKL